MTWLPALDESVDHLWQVACSDAGFKPGEDCLLMPAEGRPGGYIAYHFPPGRGFIDDGDWIVSEADREVLNLTRYGRELHRILVRLPLPSDPVALAILRHELEHADQWILDPPLYDFSVVVHRTVETWANESGLNLPGVATVYHQVPHENDANRAAALLSSTYFVLSDSEERQSEVLLRDPTAPHRESLKLRTISFALIFHSFLPKACEDNEFDLGQALNLLGDDGVTFWERLVGDNELDEIQQRITREAPSVERVESVARPRDAWVECNEAVREGRQAIETRLQTMGFV